LPLAAAELVGITVAPGRKQADPLQQFRNAGAAFLFRFVKAKRAHRFVQRVLHRQPGVQRCVRVLEHQLHFFPENLFAFPY
jgi:hypothetical protein